MRGTSKSARNGRVGMDIPHSRDTLSRALFMVGSQEEEEEEVRKALKEKDISGGGERDRVMVSAT